MDVAGWSARTSAGRGCHDGFRTGGATEAYKIMVLKRPDQGVVLQDAYQRAQELLDETVRRDTGDVVIVSCTEFPSSWVFGYQTRRFMRGDVMASMVGNGPVVVPKSGAEPYTGGSGTPIAEQVGENPV
ncbi:YrhB domain-containing protein [Actinoplanes palleronii]|uniref:YrhB domain-containing protein n=1 Tax=Actinoplanes palleronii TaxID=113570 RepID=UPI001EF1D736|nr:YrhB domain-containing protein [Actinoplanes palleronii]